MYKGQTKAEHFYSRTGSESTKGSRKGYSLLGGGEDVVAQLTPEQKRNNLVTRLKWLRLMANTTGLTTAELEEKRALDKEFKKLQREINARKPQNLPQHFMDVCREIMPHDKFQRLLEMAKDREQRHASKGGIK